MNDGALSHLTTIDLSQRAAGAYCGKLLAGFGARVIKVERPGTGDPSRSQAPYAGGNPDRERSIPHLWLNAGKQSVTLDLGIEEGRGLLDQLLRHADVLLQDADPGVEVPGLDETTLATAHPRLVRTSISNFGESGPYRGYQATEAVLYAMSGGMVATGDPQRAPLSPGPSITFYTAGLHAYIGTLMALFRRQSTDRGERVEVSIQESALDNVEIHLAEHIHQGKTARRTNDVHAMSPWQAFPCRDGHAAVIGGPIRHWLKAAPMFGEPRLTEPQFRDMGGRIKNRKEFEALLRPRIAERSGKELFEVGQSKKLGFGYMVSIDEAVRSPQHTARGFLEEVEHPRAGKLSMAGGPFGGPGARWKNRRAPLLGEHNARVLGELLEIEEDGLTELASRGVI